MLTAAEQLNVNEINWLSEQNVGEIVHINRFENALTNAVFLVTNNENARFIFKRLNRAARSDDDRESEFLVQQLASQQGLTPKVLAHSKDYKLQQYINGDLIPTNSANLSELLATQFHRIHQLPALHAPKQRLVFELQRLKKQLPVSTDEVRFNKMNELAKKLDTSSACDILCHGDLSLNNILQGSDGVLYILDWEYAVIACIAYDLAFCNCINGFSETECEALIANYHAQFINPPKQSLQSLQKECQLYFELFNYINELWSLCFVDKA